MADLNRPVDWALAKEMLMDIYEATVEGLYICDIALQTGDPASIPVGNVLLAKFFQVVEPTEAQAQQFVALYREAAKNIQALSNQLGGNEINE